MKKLFIIFLTTSFIQVSAQSVEYSEVVKVDSTLTKDELFSRARSWFVDYYKDGKEVIQVSDRETGELQAAPLFEYGFYSLIAYCTAYITYRVTVHVKDGRYKVRVYQFYNTKNIPPDGKSYGGHGEVSQIQGKATGLLYISKKSWERLLKKTEVEANAIFISLKTYMNKPATKEEDW